MIFKRKASPYAVLINFLLVFLIVLSFWGLARVRSRVRTVEYGIGALEQQKAKILRDTRFLIAQRASAFAVKDVGARVTKVAGLAKADRRKVLFVRSSGHTGPQATSMEIITSNE